MLSCPPATPIRQAYAVPRDALDFVADDVRLRDLADRLWNRASTDDRPAQPMKLELTVVPGPPASATDAEGWTIRPAGLTLKFGAALGMDVDVPTARAHGWVSEGLLQESPETVTRLLLEIPVSTLLQQRQWVVLHAGAVAGPAGAVVLRGAAGAGKSTLVAAAQQAGLDVLGDESVLVARDTADEVMAAVRDLTVEPDTLQLLGGSVAGRLADRGKFRLPLPPLAPESRRRRRVGTVLLGPRAGREPLLQPVGGDEFRREFAAGAIREEDWAGGTGDLADRWAGRSTWRLTGSNDLTGAVRLLARLVGFHPQR